MKWLAGICVVGATAMLAFNALAQSAAEPAASPPAPTLAVRPMGLAPLAPPPTPQTVTNSPDGPAKNTLQRYSGQLTQVKGSQTFYLRMSAGIILKM